MEWNKLKIGVAICGSYCTFDDIVTQIEMIRDAGADILPIMSENAASKDTRFGTASSFKKKILELTGKQIICTIEEAEKVGPNNMVDIIIIAPCTGNTLAKLANGITDTSVLMAVKGHMRNNKPVVISVSTNDALGFNLENIGKLLNAKNIYFVPFRQDNFAAKPKSMIAHSRLIMPTIQKALAGEQIQPVIQN